MRSQYAVGWRPVGPGRDERQGLSWREHLIATGKGDLHTLAVADFNGDGVFLKNTLKATTAVTK